MFYILSISVRCILLATWKWCELKMWSTLQTMIVITWCLSLLFEPVNAITTQPRMLNQCLRGNTGSWIYFEHTLDQLNRHLGDAVPFLPERDALHASNRVVVYWPRVASSEHDPQYDTHTPYIHLPQVTHNSSS